MSNVLHLPARRTLDDVRAELAALRSRVEREVEDRLALLDYLDGDPDEEDGDEDCCEAGDDRGPVPWGWEFGPGDREDGEPDADDEPRCAPDGWVGQPAFG